MGDPRGGVRHVIPSRGNHLVRHQPLAVGGEAEPFARHVLPLLERADRVAVVSAFVRESGLERIRGAVEIALRRGAHVWLLTGDYLYITQVSALELLLVWQATSHSSDDDIRAGSGLLEARVIEVDSLPRRTRSFHPKAWHLEGPGFGVALIGRGTPKGSTRWIDTGWAITAWRRVQAGARRRSCRVLRVPDRLRRRPVLPMLDTACRPRRAPATHRRL